MLEPSTQSLAVSQFFIRISNPLHSPPTFNQTPIQQQLYHHNTVAVTVERHLHRLRASSSCQPSGGICLSANATYESDSKATLSRVIIIVE